MSTWDEIPRWAKNRAYELAEQYAMDNGGQAFDMEQELSALVGSFARYISGHEQPPPDPLLTEARKLVAARYQPDCVDAIESTLRGEDDDTAAIKNCLIALRRGIELGKGLAA